MNEAFVIFAFIVIYIVYVLKLTIHFVEQLHSIGWQVVAGLSELKLSKFVLV